MSVTFIVSLSSYIGKTAVFIFSKTDDHDDFRYKLSTTSPKLIKGEIAAYFYGVTLTKGILLVQRVDCVMTDANSIRMYSYVNVY